MICNKIFALYLYIFTVIILFRFAKVRNKYLTTLIYLVKCLSISTQKNEDTLKKSILVAFV